MKETISNMLAFFLIICVQVRRYGERSHSLDFWSMISTPLLLQQAVFTIWHCAYSVAMCILTQTFEADAQTSITSLIRCAFPVMRAACKTKLHTIFFSLMHHGEYFYLAEQGNEQER